MGKQGPRSWPPLVVLQGLPKLPLSLGSVVTAVTAAVAAVALLDAVVTAVTVAEMAPSDAVVYVKTFPTLVIFRSC